MLYHKDKKLAEVSKWITYGLMGLRFIVLFVLFFLLLSPVIKYLKIYFDDPIIILAHDKSESIGLVNNITLPANIEYNKQFDDFYQILAKDFDLKYYSFGEKLDDSLYYKFDEKETDFSILFDEIRTKLINYNIGALIIATDGIYNKGRNPLYASKDFAFPIYTIALGDTTRKHDLILKNAFTNKIAFLGDDFPVEVVFSAFGYKNQKATIQVLNKGNVVATELVDITSDDFTEQLKFDIKANVKGLQSYTIVITPKEGEFSTQNNNNQLVIDIVDDKKKVLILSHGVHPDIGAIKSALETNKNILVESYTIDQFKRNIADYQLVILYQLPSSQFNVQTIISQMAQDKIPVWYILGPQTIVSVFNLLRTGIQISNNNGLIEQVAPNINAGFKLFENAEKFTELIKECPPLSAPFGNYSQNSQLDVLFYQNIKGIGTDKPLLAFENSVPDTRAKSAYLFGEGIWRWRMKDYLVNDNHEQFDAFINKIVQFLALDIKKDRFMVYQKRVFNENEEIEIRAELYNQSFELTNEPEVQMELVNSENKKFNYRFLRSGKAYQLNLGRLPQGNYTYVASTLFDGKTFTKSGEIKVVALNIEHLDLRANHQLLMQLASQSGGKMVYPAELNKLLDELKNSDSIKPVSHSIIDLADLVELKWLFFVLVLFLCIEWFVRKFFGAY